MLTSLIGSMGVTVWLALLSPLPLTALYATTALIVLLLTFLAIMTLLFVAANRMFLAQPGV